MDENYTLRVRDDQPLEGVAPLLCAGITTYSPLRRYKVGPGQKVGVVGLGGLGHMGVKLAASMGAKVTVFSTSPSKERDAHALGAHDFVVTLTRRPSKPTGATIRLDRSRPRTTRRLPQCCGATARWCSSARPKSRSK